MAITRKNSGVATLSARPSMSRDTSKAGQTVQQGSYNVTYDDNGYAVSAIHTNVSSAGGASGTSSGGASGGASYAIKNSSSSAAGNIPVVGSIAPSDNAAASYPQTTSSVPYVAADPKGADNFYAKYVGMTQADLDLLASFGVNFNNATTDEERKLWHDKAEELRASYGYSGGEDGSEFLPFSPDLYASQNRGDTSWEGGGSSGNGYDLSPYLRGLSAAQLEAQLSQLNYDYQNSLNAYAAQEAKLPDTYNTARNQAAAQNALAKQSFDQRAAAAGLSSGASAQAELSRSAAYQMALTTLDKAQADAYTDIQLAKTNLTAQYQNAVAQAQANHSIQLGTALYQEMLRVQNLQREDARFAASLEAEQQALEQKLAAEQEQLAMKLATELQLQTMKSASKGGSSSSSSSQKSYDNGLLTAEKVKEMQGYFGLTQDGLWNSDDKKATGLTANKAWEQYVTASQFLGNTKPEDSSLDTISFYEDEGVFVWNGTAYTSLKALESAIKKADLPHAKLENLEKFLFEHYGLTMNVTGA